LAVTRRPYRDANIMREKGIADIITDDTSFRRITGIQVIDPLSGNKSLSDCR